MGLFYQVENFFNNITDSISDGIYNYHLKKEYKRLEEENYKSFYVCSVSTIQSSELVFLSDYDIGQIVWRGSRKYYRRFTLDDYISDFDKISLDFYDLLMSGNFWLVNEIDDEIIEELCADFEFHCYQFKNR